MQSVIDFIHTITWETLPAEVRHHVQRHLLDTVGVGLTGRRTPLSKIILNFAAHNFGGHGARLWLDGREVSPAGAALANGMTIDSMDMHDGYQPVKGHAGAALVPAALGTLNLATTPVSGAELLASLVIGYEVALRAGVSLHATACDYHTSGAWNALGCAAITARRLGLSGEQTRHALGIAEYHGPRSQMMRVVDAPTMLKDGSGWGAMAGVSAGVMAGLGFSGAPAITVEGDAVAATWADLGQQWLITGQYFKPYAVCYWAQPALAATEELRQRHWLEPEEVERVQVYTFHEATRLTCRAPRHTDEAQYSLPFPLAALLLHGQVGAAELTGAALRDPDILALAERVELIEETAYSRRFPTERLARVEIELRDGTVYHSAEARSPWNQLDPPSDEALWQKFTGLAESMLPPARVDALAGILRGIDTLPDATQLEAALAEPA
jgi:2-methylcitrate dehydratase PrpD